MKKRVIVLGLLITVFLNIFPVSAMKLTSSNAIVKDVNNGAVYYEINADTPLAPASMTKVMTVYMIYEEIEKGNLSKDTLITADAADYAASVDPEATNVTLKEGQQYSIDELIGAILVPSACAASAMVGKYIAGSEAAFSAKMTARARELGLNAFYDDASGLSDNNRITPRSMADLVIMLVTKYPDVLNYTSKSSIVFGGKKYNSTNKMLAGGTRAYPGVDGLKTGTTTLAGACYSSTAVNADTRLVSVTMHSAYGTSRFDDTKQLLDYGFSKANERYNNLYPTDMHVFLNNHEVPAFLYNGDSSYLVFLAEDLANYGFDVHWDGMSATLEVEYNNSKPISPIDTAMYRAYDKNKPLLPIDKSAERNVFIKYENTTLKLENVHALNGYIAISADEISSIAKSTYWDNNKRSLYMEF